MTALILFSLLLNGQQKFVLKADLKGFSDGTVFKIIPYLDDMNADMDNQKLVRIVDGKFEYEAKLSGPTKFSLQAMPPIPPDDPAEFESVGFWAENKPMTITGEKGKLILADISGSEIQDEYSNVSVLTKDMELENKSIFASLLHGNLKASDKELYSRKYRENNAAIEKERVEFILEHPEFLSCEAELVMYINYIPGWVDLKQATDFYERLNPDMQVNVYGKQILKYITTDKTYYPRLKISDMPYDFQLPDEAGNLVSLSDFSGKYVLLDFWGSGCGPCRAEHKNYLENYKKYHAKGFGILSISQDQSNRLWKKAMEEDNMIWTSVWDQKQDVVKMYQVSYLPTNYLIDRNGYIIAKDIRGEKLTRKLEELF